MMDQFTRDALAVLLVIYGLIIMVVEIDIFIHSKFKYRWIFLAKSFSGFSLAFIFVLALLRLYNGTDVIDAVLGRPVYLVLATALFLGALYTKGRG